MKKLLDSLNTPLLRSGYMYGKRIIAGSADIIAFILVMVFKSIFVNKQIGLFYTYPILFISSLGTFVLLAGLTLSLKRYARLAALLAIDIMASVVMFGDIVYFRYFNDVISVPVLRQVILMDSLQSSVSNLFKLSDILFGLDILVAAFILVFLIRKKVLISNDKLRIRVIKAVSTAVIGAAIICYGFVQVQKMVGTTTFSSVYDHTFFVEKLGVMNFHGFDAYYYLSNNVVAKKGVPQSDMENIKAVFANKTQGKTEAKKLNGIAKGYNLIVIQVEALQSMLIDFKINGREVTPNLNRFAKRSLYFNNYFSQTAQGGTSDAEFLSNVSYYPLPEGAVYFMNATNTFESLPKAMKDIGYSTMVMHSFKGSYWNRSTVYPVLGFDKFISMKDYVFDEAMGWGLSDRSFLKQSLKMLQSQNKPFYSFVITLSSHYPYDAFQNNTGFDAGPFNGTFFGSYLRAENYTDKALGEFLDGIEQSGLLDNSVVVIYGDHFGIQKERMNEIKDYFKLVENNDLSYLNMIKVPLIIHLPGDKEKGTRTTAGGQIDLFPTIANLYGIQPKYCLGKDLLNTDKGYAVIRDGSITDGKTVFYRKYGQCFDLDTGEVVDSAPFEEYISIAENDLKVSDKVLQNDLIRKFEEQRKK
ncbi:MAG: LTA synthase family protein [Clostridia bacterium]|nr:LTA synthase family protein [Clostridia bacterium]